MYVNNDDAIKQIFNRYRVAKMSNSRSNSIPIDRLSDLPDTILSHILSFLPTDKAFATSILSSRYKDLWKNTSTLTFRYTRCPYGDLYIYGKDSNTGRFMEFLNFVTRTLLIHDTKCLDKFCLHILERNVLYDYITRELIKSWVSASVARNVKDLVVAGRQKRYPERRDFLRLDLPSCTYNCNSLEVLHLSGVVILNPYGLVSLPNLRTLRLDDVLLISDESIKKLLSGCLSLKTLYIRRGCHDRVGTLTVPSPTLERLTITTCGREFNYHETHQEQCVNLELHVPALKYLCIHDEMVNDISMEDMPSLEEAKISLCLQFFHNQLGCNWNGIVSIFRSIGRVKLLSLDEFTLKALSQSGLSPKLERLANLTLTVGCCQWSSLQDMLEVSDSLEYLTLNIYFVKHHHESCWIKPKKIAACLSSLKEMSIEGFAGHDDELAMLGYILKNASLLEKMKITTSSPLDLTKKHQLLQHVSKIRRSSKMCEVIYLSNSGRSSLFHVKIGI